MCQDSLQVDAISKEKFLWSEGLVGLIRKEKH